MYDSIELDEGCKAQIALEALADICNDHVNCEGCPILTFCETIWSDSYEWMNQVVYDMYELW